MRLSRIFICVALPVVDGLLHPIHVTSHQAASAPSYFSSFSLIEGTSLLATIENTQQFPLPFSTRDFKKDQVIRVIDANTIKLQRSGLVSLAAVKTPTPGSGNFQFPKCFTYSPAYKIRLLLPANTPVLVKMVSSSQAVIVRSNDMTLINQEIVKAGFARVRTPNPASEYLKTKDLQTWQSEAKAKGLGIFKRCDDAMVSVAPVAEFEALEFTVETEWSDDGGKQVVRQRESVRSKPKNPGDTKGKFPQFEVFSLFRISFLTRSVGRFV
jgi:endonuclease YncB( thermonuclease family)